MGKHTLLLCFIHGFKGDDGTFGNFPNHLRALVQTARPQLNVAIAIYPQYETRGELASAVARFRDWLQTTVIDLEVVAGTANPTIDPSVHTILVGHSMGGIVAADTVLSIVDDDRVGRDGGDTDTPLLFPDIAGILAFDTPFLGLSPSVFAHSAEGNWKSATSAYSTISSLASGLFASKAVVNATSSSAGKPKALLEKDDKKSTTTEVAGQSSMWGGWGKFAAYSGAAAALAGGATAVYFKRQELGQGYDWVSSHLEFVSALMNGDNLQRRVERVSSLGQGVGFANLFTSLGGDRMGTSMLFEGKERTFCSLPTEGSRLRRRFYRSVNVRAQDEVAAHCSMFDPATNPGYYELADRASKLISFWVKDDSYLPMLEARK